MKITIASSLFPPDIASPASYIKSLAERLSGEHEVTLVLYGHIPEPIENVHFVVILKSENTAMRLLKYTIALFKAARHADVVLAQNGVSVELPLVLISPFWRRKLILAISDTKASVYTNYLQTSIHKLACMCARTVITQEGIPTPIIHKNIFSIPYPTLKPEILPFVPHPTDAQAQYNASWDAHIKALHNIL